MFYTVRFNASLAALGINPQNLNPELRRLGQEFGSKFGLSPQEAVLMTLSEMPMESRPSVAEIFVQIWIDDGKVDFHKEDMQSIFMRLGLWALRLRR